jgi:hypothetical protein
MLQPARTDGKKLGIPSSLPLVKWSPTTLLLTLSCHESRSTN